MHRSWLGIVFAVGLFGNSTAQAYPARASSPPPPAPPTCQDKSAGLSPDKALTATKQCDLSRAQSAEKAGNYEECGRAYVDYVNDYTDDDVRDESIYSAAVCWEKAGTIGTAIRLYRQVEREYPNSQFVAKSLLRLGQALARVQLLPEAAESLSKYGLKYAGEHDAQGAVHEAIGYWRVLGKDDEAIALTKKFIATFGRKDKAAAADAYFALASIYERRGETTSEIAHLTSYLKMYGQAGTVDRLPEATATLGRLLWEQSCPVPLVDGICAKRVAKKSTRKAAAPTTCSAVWAATTPLVTPLVIVAREPRKLRSALANFSRVVAMTSKPTEAANPWRAQSLLLLADYDLEALLAIKPPTGLDFDEAKPKVARESFIRFEEWMRATLVANGTLRDKYVALAATSDSPTKIAAQARIGLTFTAIATALGDLEFPRNIRKFPKAVTAFCEALQPHAASVRSGANTAFESCVSTSRSESSWTAASVICASHLGLAYSLTERGTKAFVATQVLTLEAPVLSYVAD